MTRLCDILKKALVSPVYSVIKKTPLEYAKFLSEKTKSSIFLKREDTLSPVFSFKLRGAFNRMSKLSSNDKKNGVVACSAGNHAQGVAFSAKKLNIDAKIVMPRVTPDTKIKSVKKLGAQVIIQGDDFDESKKIAMDIANKENRVLIHPFDNIDVIAGQATIGLEILQQIDTLTHIFCCVGGGGLISGIGSIIKELKPNIKIIGVEAYDQNAMTQSLLKGKRVELPKVGTYADGSAVKIVGEHTFDICRRVVDDMVLVSNDEITMAIKDGFNDTRTILEPSGALAIAGCKKYLSTVTSDKKKYNCVVVTSGANIDFTKLRHISNIQEDTEGFIAITIPEEIGSFKYLYDTIYPRAVTEFSYRYTNSDKANILLGFKGDSSDDIGHVIDKLRDIYETTHKHNVIDLRNNILARDHFRYSSVLNSLHVENERIFRFHFPEFPGALDKFLTNLTHDFNVTLFNYKNQGGHIGKVLVGLQVDNDAKLNKFLQNLDYEYFDETNNELYKRFL